MAKKRSNRLGKLRFRFDKKLAIDPTRKAIEGMKRILAREMAEAVQDELTVRYPPPSVPGERPHIRTGTLKRSIHGVVSGGKIRIRMVSYGANLERGNKTGNRMKARPFVRPTLFSKTAQKLWASRGREIVERLTRQEIRRSVGR